MVADVVPASKPAISSIPAGSDVPRGAGSDVPRGDDAPSGRDESSVEEERASSMAAPAPKRPKLMPAGRHGDGNDGSAETAAPAEPRAVTAVQAAAPSTANDLFKADYAAAVQRLLDGDGAAGGENDAAAEVGGGTDEPNEPLGSVDDAGGQGARGLGFGASRPDVAKVLQVQRNLAAANEKKHQAALKAGLNQGGGVSGGPRSEGVIGPARPAAGASTTDVQVRRVQPGVPRGGAQPGAGDEPDYGWKPPTDQSGDGRTSLNAKLGY